MLKSIFERKSSRVLRVLLSRAGEKWTLRELAGEAKVSLGMSHYVSEALTRMGLATREESGRLMLIEPQRLLKQWAAATNYSVLNVFQEFYTFDTEFEAFLSRFKRFPPRFSRRYALTLHAAAWLVAPYVRPNDFHLYVHPSLGKEGPLLLARALGLSLVEKSGNVKLVTPYDEGVFYGSTQAGGVNVVSPVQLYVDLYNYPGRGEEAADKVLEKIAKSWEQAQNV